MVRIDQWLRVARAAQAERARQHTYWRGGPNMPTRAAAALRVQARRFSRALGVPVALVVANWRAE